VLTLHAADLLVTGDRRPSVPGGAVLVDGPRLAAAGPFETLAAAHPAARVRRWPGVLTPGLLHPYGVRLLELAYHPDPREAAELGTEPLSGTALAGLGMTGSRWSAGARRGVQRMLAHGITAVAAPAAGPRRAGTADAVHRVGLTVVAGRAGADPAELPARAHPFDVFDALGLRDPLGACDPLGVRDPQAAQAAQAAQAVPAEAFAGPLPVPLPAAGGTADATFAVFDAADEAELLSRGTVTCVATVLKGRLVHRRR
jgi:hypothetical protein